MNSSEQHLLEDIKKSFPNFSCNLQDLRNPTEDFVTNFYTFWLSEFEVNIATLPQAQFSQLQIANVSLYNDTYTSTIPKLNLLQAIRAFNVVHDFGIMDIVSPTPKRIQSVIRAFCEFYQWCDLRIFALLELKQAKKISERKKIIASLLQEKQNLQEELNNVFKGIGQLQDAKKELEGELVKYQYMAAELRLEKEMFKTQSDEANEKFKEKEAILHKLIKEESKISNKIKDCSNQVVDSPTSVMTDLNSLRAKDKEMKALSEQKRDLVESKMKAQKDLEEVVSSVEEKSGELDKVLRLIEHRRKLLHVVSDIEKVTVVCQEDLKQLKSSLISVLSKKTNREEELQAINLKWKNMKDQLEKSVEAAKIELTNKEAVKREMLSDLKENVKVEEEINSMMEKIQNHVKAFEYQYAKILDQENACLEKLRSEGLARSEKARREAEKKLQKLKRNKSKK